MAKILKNSSKYGNKTSGAGARYGKVGSFRGKFFGLWAFTAIIWLGLLLFAYYWSSQKEDPGYRIKAPKKDIGEDKRSYSREDVGKASTDTENSSEDPGNEHKIEKSAQKTSGVKNNDATSPETTAYTPSLHSSSVAKDNHRHAVTRHYPSTSSKASDGSTYKSTESPVAQLNIIKGRVSIIIDDMGGSIEIARKFLQLPYPLAFAVLPYEPYSGEVARLVRSNGKVLLLHMPMEPHEYPDKNPGKGSLMLGQNRDTQRKLFLKALEQVPGAVGVNNHMGSKFTENREAMRFFMEMLKERDLFFVDSATTDKTVACDVAREVGVKCYRRNVFLDHETSISFVNAQLVRLAAMAKERDITIAIGHPHRITLDILRRGLKDIENRNVELVSLGNIRTYLMK